MQYVKLILNLIEVLVFVVGGLAWIFGFLGRKLGLVEPDIPPAPDHNVGARPLKSDPPPER